MSGSAVRTDYNRTIFSCFAAYIVQAVVNNFAPLLFVTFQTSYSISLSGIAMLVSFNFVVQILTDFLSSIFVDRIGVRPCIVAAHVTAAAGLICLGILPEILPDPLIGLMISVAIYAVGGGLIEVLVSPIVESCPTKSKEREMSMLHSFYCWGHAGVVIVSTLFFRIAGISNWRYLAFIYAVLTLANGVSFLTAPLVPFVEEGERGLTIGELIRDKFFWVLFVMMLCAGASEQAVSQWASTFAESALGVSKTVGDLAGPMMFAILMGISRAYYGKKGDTIDLDRFMLLSTALCIASYMLIVLSPVPALSLVGCAVTGFSVGILWPGTFSKGAQLIKNGGTALFAFLALAGDVGCSVGPGFAGLVSDTFGGNLKAGIAAAIIFPAVLLAVIVILMRRNKKEAHTRTS